MKYANTPKAAIAAKIMYPAMLVNYICLLLYMYKKQYTIVLHSASIIIVFILFLVVRGIA